MRIRLRRKRGLNMRIETKRCIIRRFQETDIDAFMKYRNNKEWMKYQGFTGLSRAEYCEELLAQTSLSAGMQLAIIEKKSDTLLGDLYLIQENDVFLIGYTICPESARNGFATEAVKSLIEWIEKQGNYKIMAAVLPENLPSKQLLKKMKFVFIKLDEYGDEVYLLQNS